METPSENKISLSVFFPAYCEEKNLETLIPKALATLEGLGLRDDEVIVVDDGSVDRTAEVVERWARENPKVRLVRHPTNLGYGMALRSGFAAARMDYVFYSDGDNQYDLDELKKFVALVPHTDLVIGFRVQKRYTLYRQLTSFTYNLIIRLLFDLPVRDVDCAFKLYPRALFDRIQLESQDSFIDAEILIKARALNLRTTEVGVTHLPRPAGVSIVARPGAILRVLREVIAAYFKSGRGRRP